MSRINEYFTTEEFACKCCGESKMDEHFIAQLTAVRQVANIPFVIVSGYRCTKHNQEVHSFTENHVKGMAADIRCITSADRFKIINAAIKFGFNRIGVYGTFIHLDDNADAPQDVIWTA